MATVEIRNSSIIPNTEFCMIPATLFLGICPKKSKFTYYRNIYSSVFIVILFTTVNSWDQLTCSPGGEGRRKWVSHIYTVLSARKT